MLCIKIRLPASKLKKVGTENWKRQLIDSSPPENEVCKWSLASPCKINTNPKKVHVASSICHVQISTTWQILSIICPLVLFICYFLFQKFFLKNDANRWPIYISILFIRQNFSRPIEKGNLSYIAKLCRFFYRCVERLTMLITRNN